jgi:hypothetical protein
MNARHKRAGLDELREEKEALVHKYQSLDSE